MATSQMGAAPMEPARQNPVSRVTKQGRRLWYRLTVLQEPERARACGSGPKSTTDRRPVDPPPIVELRIFEGDSIETGKDITFTYNANFFLYATLEHARPIANGRVNTPAATSPPVLTGLPVSGMAYLDRPTEAGYFLFPDLSVRHEGRYKFVFSLYEQTKDDQDRNPGDGTEESFDHRLQVESKAFNVYSAKKFPGLTESTALSRTISEQGCRVRIRRDVRMRRREGKPSGGNDYESQQKEEYERRQRTQTPELKPDPYRARSLSNSSVERVPYDPYRRSSLAEYPRPPPPPAYGAAPSTPTSAGGHLQFGQAASQYPAPPPPQHYGPPPSQQRHSSPIPSQQQYTPPSSRPFAQPQPPQYPPPHQASPAPAPTSLPPLPHPSERPPSKTHYYPPPAQVDSYDSSRRSSTSLPPVRQSEFSIENLCSQLPSIKPAPPSGSSTEALDANSLNRAPRKRAYDETFPSEGSLQRLSNRSRQQDPHMYPPSNPQPGYDDANNDRLTYKRASGSVETKPAPEVRY